MGMSSGGGDKKAVASEINVTPLIDVLLVLLIIFLVVMPIMMKKEELTTPPKLDDNQAPNPDSSLLSVKLMAGGQAVFGDGVGPDRQIQVSQVIPELRDKLNAVKPGTEKVVFVDFEHGVHWSEVVSLMDSLRSLATDANHDEVKVALTICDWDKRSQEGCAKPQ